MNIIIDDSFYNEYKDYVASILTHKGLDQEDLVHDVFEAALLHVDYYNNDFKGTVYNWINQLVIHVIDRHKRSKDIMNMDTHDIDFSDDSTEAFMVTSEDLLNPVNEHYYNDHKDEVNMFINMLPNRQRDVVYLKLILGCTHEEISEKLSISKSNSESNYGLGIKNLKKLIESDKPEDEVLRETKLLKPYLNTSYSGNWAWRPNESPDRSAGKVKRYSRQEIKAYCQERNLKYA